MQVKTTAYQGNLQNCLVYAPSSEPFVSSVCLYFAVSPFGLYGAVHSGQRTMNTVQVVENLLVNGRQFIVQPNDPVKSAFVTSRSMWAAAAILVHRELHVFFHSMLLVVQSIFSGQYGTALQGTGVDE